MATFRPIGGAPPRSIYVGESSKLAIVETEDNEIALIMRSRELKKVGLPVHQFNPTPTLDELRSMTPLDERQRADRFYNWVNEKMQEARADPIFRRAGMLSVSTKTPPDLINTNHCIFWRRFRNTIYIFDPNDDEYSPTRNYVESFQLKSEEVVTFVHPLHESRFVSLNSGYGAGVCRAISFALSRLWGKIEESKKSVGLPKRNRGDATIVDVDSRRFQLTLNEFVRLLSSGNVTAKKLIRLALGRNYDEIIGVLANVRNPPKMTRALEVLQKDAEDDEVSDDVERVSSGAGAGAGAGAGLKRAFIEIED